MPKITSVEPQKLNPHRFNIFLDSSFAFGADEDLIVEYRLLVGKEISQELLEKILFDAEVGKLMERLYRLSSDRMHSEKEIKDYLKRLSFKRKVKAQDEISDIVISKTIEKAKKKGITDDEQFARSWMESRSKKYGPQKIKQELFQKGIDRKIIDEVIGSWLMVHGKPDIATEILEKKIKLWKNLKPFEVRKKAYEYLLRRGFDYEVIKKIIEKIDKKE